MNFFNRLKKGWDFAKISFQTLNENRELVLFPVFSSISLIFILLTFFGGGFFLFSEQIEAAFDSDSSGILGYAAIFLYYLVNYFIVVFFNSALVHCSIKIFNNESTSMSDGLQFAVSKIGKIFSWAILSATIGMVLQMIQNSGRIGEFISSLLGSAWSILTFFAVPILIYEEKNVFETVKESGRIIKERWGESLAGSFSFGIIQFLGFLVAIGIFFLFSFISPEYGTIVGMVVGGILVLLTFTITSAADVVFKSAIYNHVNDRPAGRFDSQSLDSIFTHK